MVVIGKIKSKKGPEKKIQDKIIRYLREREWFVRSTHGNQYQSGFPDLFAAKRRYGIRWIEIKNPANYKFTNAQLDCFPKFSKNGIGLWILSEATDASYDRLFKAPNWASYLPVAQVHMRNRARRPREEIERKKVGRGPERDLQNQVTEKLESDGWFVLETHGSLYQHGFPDIYACKKGEQRWIELKIKGAYKFTGAQLETFPRLTAEGVGIWIVTNTNHLFDCIMGKPNWHKFLI
jgi:Holliday junction resolvase